MPFELDDNNYESGVNIKVVGVGGGGNNALNRMVNTNVRGVDFIAINTDTQALLKSSAPVKIAIGERCAKGKGAGSNPDLGAMAAEESSEEIKQALEGADMVFIAAGMGGGTGTGAAPVVARLAQEMGILTVGIVTKPFVFERKKRMDQAEAGIENLKQYVDSLIIIPNERLKAVEEKITFMNAFQIADDVLSHGVQSITELINVPEYINLDFADVTAIMKDAGYAHMGMGEGTGKGMAEEAARSAIHSPLLETTIAGAKGVLISVTVSPDIPLEEIEAASALITDEAAEDATVIWGAAFDPSLEDTMKVTIIATGFENKNEVDAAFNKKAESGLRPVAYGKKSPAAVKPETKVVEQQKPVQKKPVQPVEPEPEDEKDDDSAISEDDFNEIIKMLNMNKNGQKRY
ncbi:MAG: cell division protein FtsZ [Ruminococcaceae bacterium]|nr:cell division protein FtsZ [Oscillospiraceae bacterium]